DVNHRPRAGCSARPPSEFTLVSATSPAAMPHSNDGVGGRQTMPPATGTATATMSPATGRRCRRPPADDAAGHRQGRGEGQRGDPDADHAAIQATSSRSYGGGRTENVTARDRAVASLGMI